MTDREIYINIELSLTGLIDETYPIITNLSNFIALLNQSFEKISWVGFYIKISDILILGPYQGKVACNEIKIGKGVCGVSAKERKTIIVSDVNKFEGHIACDADSLSEIVIPVFDENDKLFGVLDIDSYSLNSFNEIDKYYLERFLSSLSNKLDLKNFKIK